MILVTLGTQDKSFKRLLDSLDKEIENGKIKDEVIVQAGFTEYKSKNMKIFDYISKEEMDDLVSKCDLCITHGGVGSIFAALNEDKKIIAVPRLQKYGEHTNDHQLEVVEEFSKAGYLIALYDMKDLVKVIEEAKTFKPNKYKSNNENMIKLLNNYIESNNKTPWFNKILNIFFKNKELLMYLIFGVLTTLVNILTFFILDKLGVNTYINNTIAWIASVLFAFVTNKLFVFESRDTSKDTLLKEGISFFGFRLLSYLFDMLFMFLFVSVLSTNKMISKVVVNVIVVVVNYIFSKLFIFKK